MEEITGSLSPRLGEAVIRGEENNEKPKAI